jgi:hypothetical protein
MACIRYLSLAAVTEARIRSCSGLQLNEGRIVLNHSAPRRPTRPIQRAESCQVLLHALVTLPSPFVPPETVVAPAVYTARAILHVKGGDVWRSPDPFR